MDLPAVVSSVDEVADPRRLSPPSIVSDAARILSGDPVSRYLKDLRETEEALGGRLELLLVTLDDVRSIDSGPGALSSFAEELFEHWQVGGEARAGLLLLHVREAQRVFIVAGEGVAELARVEPLLVEALASRAQRSARTFLELGADLNGLQVAWTTFSVGLEEAVRARTRPQLHPNVVEKALDVADPRLDSPASYLGDIGQLLRPEKRSELRTILHHTAAAGPVRLLVVTLSLYLHPSWKGVKPADGRLVVMDTAEFQRELCQWWAVGPSEDPLNEHATVLLLVIQDLHFAWFSTGPNLGRVLELDEQGVDQLWSGKVFDGMSSDMQDEDWASVVWFGATGYLDSVQRRLKELAEEGSEED